MSIWIVMLMVLCNMMALRGSKILISLFSIELGASQAIIGVLVALYSLFPMALAIYAGKLTDRMGVRWPVAAGSLGISLGLTLPYLFPSLIALYLQAALVGAAHVFYNVAIQNLIGGIGTSEDRARNYSNFGLAMSVGGFMGPLAAGIGIDHVGHARTYLMVAALPLITMAIMLSARRMSAGASHGARRADKNPADGTRSRPFELFVTNRPLRRVLITSAVILTGIDLFHFYMPIYGHSIGLSASKIGIVLSMFSAASFVVRFWMPAIVNRIGDQRVLVLSTYVAAATYLAVPFITHAVVLCVVAFMLGLGTGLGQPLSLTLIYDRAPEGRSGEALGLRLTLNNFTHMMTPLLFGAIGTAFGVVPVFLCNSLMLLGGGIIIRRK